MNDQAPKTRKQLPTFSGDDIVLKITKEIAIKFIETGRISPSSFDTAFKSIYKTIDATVEGKSHA